jgi:hypothetical protein
LSVAITIIVVTDQAWWPFLRRLRKEDFEFKASLDYIVNSQDSLHYINEIPSQNTKNKTKQNS